MKQAMRRVDKHVADRSWQEEILQKGTVIYLALATPDGEPYVLPMGYGYADGAIYLHGAAKGLKNDLIAKNPRVSFNVSTDVEVMRGDVGSEFSMRYRSVTGFGRIVTLEGLAEKNAALAAIMKQYDGPHDDLTEAKRNAVWVARIEIDELTGKNSGYPKPE